MITTIITIITMIITIGYSSKGGAVGGGVQWMGVVLYNKLVYNIV